MNDVEQFDLVQSIAAISANVSAFIKQLQLKNKEIIFKSN